ncbi:cobyric acid synthase [Clostridiaceae bacterium HSG29]|nr:cobyric acid synthase [Clostridiaceae bacterium HSG29]
MNKSIMILGTGSSVGKSVITAGLLRVLKQDGYKVAPFKSQNMALNSYITKKGNEMGRAQVVQAEAAMIEPDVRMNPILLKPSADKMAQVIIEGKVFKNMTAMEYETFKPELKEKIGKIYGELSSENDIVVIEGAGSPAEINLRKNDIVNMGMAEISNSPVLIVGDIDKGGVFASLYGTYELLREEEKKRVKGVIINKFRGDVEILKPGLKQLEDLINVPVLGVVPYFDIQIEDEDSVSDRFKNNLKKGEINIEVIYLPHISNFTDFNIFKTFEDVNLRYVMRGEKIGNPDLIIIPGSKNTIEDLVYLRNSGLEEQIIRLNRKGTTVFGVCGGYQMLGNTLNDPYKTESRIESVNGLGLLNIETVFELEKNTTQIEGHINENGNYINGYEIHMGVTTLNENVIPLLTIDKSLGEVVNKLDGAVNAEKTVYGTYIHGIFDSIDFSRSLINDLRIKKGLNAFENEDIMSYDDFKEKEYDKLAVLIRENMDIDKIKNIINEGIRND